MKKKRKKEKKCSTINESSLNCFLRKYQRRRNADETSHSTKPDILFITYYVLSDRQDIPRIHDLASVVTLE